MYLTCEKTAAGGALIPGPHCTWTFANCVDLDVFVEICENHTYDVFLRQMITASLPGTPTQLRLHNEIIIQIITRKSLENVR